ncbi:MAG TPA: TerC/Alx family metal homeostasis membrane protein [Candidatus Acidoferrum sp.]|jgi:tellurite resistance protein TerC
MGSLSRWVLFNIFVLAAVSLDLGVFNRKPHKFTLRESALWSGLWIGLAGLFGLGVLWFLGRQPALEFFTGYLIEKALSIDNLFLFLVIFHAFSVDERVQHRLLAWGVFGALVMRGIMIGLGAALIERFAWIMYLFGAFLVYAGIHMLLVRAKETHPEQNSIFQFASRHLRATRQYHGQKFFVRLNKQLFATPLFLVLLVVEITDITLAVDSIPAIFGITHDAFIVYTSNVFAVMGLRALYFMLAGVLSRLRYLKVGLSFVLIFIGGKMIAEPWVDIPVHISLGIVAGILLLALLPSLLSPAQSPPDDKSSAAAKSPAALNGQSSGAMPAPISFAIAELAAPESSARSTAALEIYQQGRGPADNAVADWWRDPELSALLSAPEPRVTVGVAVQRETFAAIRAANGTPALADVPPDQDAEEFELHFANGVALDVLTTREPGGQGAIARFLSRFGEGVQQVEFQCRNVARATAMLRERFGIQAVYPEPRRGAGGTTINFFLLPVSQPGSEASKVLIELYELPESSTSSGDTHRR